MQQIAIYDMDKTITRRATFVPFVVDVFRQHPLRALALPFMAMTTLAFVLRLVDRARLKEYNLRLLVGAMNPQARLESLGRRFAVHTLSTNILPAACAQIEADRRNGAMIVLATASYRFYVNEIARGLGIEKVVATELQSDCDGLVHSRIDGENCYGEAKLHLVKSWLADQGIQRENVHIRFYSDHISDRFCLDWADEAFAVNPHQPLRELAQKQNWPILDWLSER